MFSLASTICQHRSWSQTLTLNKWHLAKRSTFCVKIHLLINFSFYIKSKFLQKRLRFETFFFICRFIWTRLLHIPKDFCKLLSQKSQHIWLLSKKLSLKNRMFLRDLKRFQTQTNPSRVYFIKKCIELVWTFKQHDCWLWHKRAATRANK